MNTHTNIHKKAKSMSAAVLNNAKMEDESVSGISDKMMSTYEDIKDQVSNAASTSVSFVKKYPLYTLAGVAAVGIAARLYLRSRKSV